MERNPYKPPDHPTQQNSRLRLTRWRAFIVSAVVVIPFTLLAIYCFLTAWSYVGTTAAADHPYVPGYLQAGTVCLAIGATLGLATYFLSSFYFTWGLTS